MTCARRQPRATSRAQTATCSSQSVDCLEARERPRDDTGDAAARHRRRCDAGSTASRHRSCAPARPPAPAPASARETRERMSKRRATIARRLVEAQHTAAMLTTFNEVDMTRRDGAARTAQGGVPEAARRRPRHRLLLRQGGGRRAQGIPAAQRRDSGRRDRLQALLRHRHGGGRRRRAGRAGAFATPIGCRSPRSSWRSATSRSARRTARSRSRICKGGTFTITNGGVFGSLMSTPILNPPQVGILGLHKIAERPVAVNGQVVIRPMMYRRAQLRSPHRRRARGGAVPRQDQGVHRGSGGDGPGIDLTSSDRAQRWTDSARSRASSSAPLRDRRRCRACSGRRG